MELELEHVIDLRLDWSWRCSWNKSMTIWGVLRYGQAGSPCETERLMKPSNMSFNLFVWWQWRIAGFSNIRCFSPIPLPIRSPSKQMSWPCCTSSNLVWGRMWFDSICRYVEIITFPNGPNTNCGAFFCQGKQYLARWHNFKPLVESWTCVRLSLRNKQRSCPRITAFECNERDSHGHTYIFDIQKKSKNTCVKPHNLCNFHSNHALNMIGFEMFLAFKNSNIFEPFWQKEILSRSHLLLGLDRSKEQDLSGAGSLGIQAASKMVATQKYTETHRTTIRTCGRCLVLEPKQIGA